MKKIMKEIFIDGLSGMASGLFATLIIGTIIVQIGNLIPGAVGQYLIMMGKVASALTGAGIGVGVALRLKSSPLVIVSAATAGMTSAFASKIIAGTVLVDGVMQFAGPGEPLGAFIGAMICVYMGRLVSGKTKVDILITPFVCIVSGSAVGLLIGPTISSFMAWLGSLINWGTEQAPFIMGIVVSVLMGIILTLPISSAALGIILGLNGLAAGAATVGCCANMVGFAVASYRENKMNGLLAQGLGTSMLQIGNIVKKPVIWLPAIITSAILGPVSTLVFKMTNNATGSGMGTAGLVGQINTYQDMVSQGAEPAMVLIKILVLQIVLPALLAFVISEFMRKKGIISTNDMKLDV
ncbi:MAG: PTS sugar transporter subunit IIC [Lachnospiraceae bacterium]|nr:PTS sugar transporter subunit IIC [Lachnospiraceae bacterium]